MSLSVTRGGSEELGGGGGCGPVKVDCWLCIRWWVPWRQEVSFVLTFRCAERAELRGSPGQQQSSRKHSRTFGTWQYGSSSVSIHRGDVYCVGTNQQSTGIIEPTVMKLCTVIVTWSMNTTSYLGDARPRSLLCRGGGGHDEAH